MQVQYLVALWAVIVYILYRIFTSIARERYYALEEGRRGCEKPPRFQNELPFGIDHVIKAVNADKAKRFPEHMIARYAKMGNKTFEHKILGTVGITTNDPKNIQAVLATQFKDFELGERRRAILSPILGNGIFAADGKNWEHSRAMMRPQFAREQVSDLKLEEEHVQNMMRALQPNAQTHWTPPVDLQVLFFRLTLDSACEFLFGESIDSQIINLPENDELRRTKATTSTTDEITFAGAFDRGQAWLAHRSRLMGFYYIVDGPSARRDTRAIHNFVDHFVQLALSRHSPSSSTILEKAPSSPITASPLSSPTSIKPPSSLELEIEKGTLPSTFPPRRRSSNYKYVFLEALASQTRDPLELRFQLLNILLAGRDTTASLLGWTFYLLARHASVFGKLRHAILADFGAYPATSAISYTSLKSCAYLQHVLAETLRLFPVVPVNMRQAVRDTTLPRGGGPDGAAPILVRKGMVIDYSVHVMQRLESLWGPDAAEFKPERWVGRKPGWEYLPFNGGARICLGQQFALTEASYVLVRLLQRFDQIQNLDASVETTHNLTLTSCPAKGVQVRLREAGR